MTNITSSQSDWVCLKQICLAVVRTSFFVWKDHYTLLQLFCYVAWPKGKTARESYYAGYYADKEMEKKVINLIF